MVSYSYPSAFTQYRTDFYWGTLYNTTRNMNGVVYFRLRDVTTDYDPWAFCEFRIRLVIAATGGTAASAVVYKSWGVLPAFTNMGNIGAHKLIKLQVNPYVRSANGTVLPNVTWTGELMWG